MPKVHNIGKQHFVQLLTNYRVEWGFRVAVKGWTQEINEPFRTSAPWIVRLPFDKALVCGKWTGRVDDEEDALNRALQGRVLKDEDFQEGWTAPAYKNAEEDSWDIYS
jgi:hypothetical protein